MWPGPNPTYGIVHLHDCILGEGSVVPQLADLSMALACMLWVTVPDAPTLACTITHTTS